jgi:tetratricopeptide (TPR) repeat protein
MCESDLLMFERTGISGCLWRRAGRVAVLVGLLGLAVHQQSRNDALVAAREAFALHLDRAALAASLVYLDHHPNDPEANRIAASSLSKLAYARRAEPYYGRAGRLTGDEQNARAFALFRAHELDAAEAISRQVLRETPEEPTALRQLALIRFSRGNVVDALALARELSRSADPQASLVGLAMLGEFSLGAGVEEDVVTSFDEILKRDPELKSIVMPKDRFWLHYVQALVGRGEGRRVVGLEPRAIREAGEGAELVFWIGRAFELLGDHAGAESRWKRAVALDPKLVAGWSFLGRLELSQRRPEAAIAYLDRALELEPSSYSTLYSLMLAHQQLGQTDEARRYQGRIDAITASTGGPPTAGTGMGAPVAGGER